MSPGREGVWTAAIACGGLNGSISPTMWTMRAMRPALARRGAGLARRCLGSGRDWMWAAAQELAGSAKISATPKRLVKEVRAWRGAGGASRGPATECAGQSAKG